MYANLKGGGMLRYLSAIGMSRYVDMKALDAWLMEFLQGHPEDTVRYSMPGSPGIHMEYAKDMGPFKLIVRTRMTAPGELHVYSVMPAARAGTISRALDWQLGVDESGLFVWGEDEHAGGALEMLIARSGQAIAMHCPQSGPKISLAYSALSVEGKIILGIQRTKEDLEFYEDEEEWRRQMMERIRSGDQEALEELEYDAREQEKEIEERMRHEDVYTVLEGLFVPADEMTAALYQVMGTILDVEKVLNQTTEEWVYHLQLDVMGSPLDVYIHPDDLVGAPSKGMRFVGKARLIGSLFLIGHE